MEKKKKKRKTYRKEEAGANNRQKEIFPLHNKLSLCKLKIKQIRSQIWEHTGGAYECDITHMRTHRWHLWPYECDTTHNYENTQVAPISVIHLFSYLFRLTGETFKGQGGAQWLDVADPHHSALHTDKLPFTQHNTIISTSSTYSLVYLQNRHAHQILTSCNSSKKFTNGIDLIITPNLLKWSQTTVEKTPWKSGKTTTVKALSMLVYDSTYFSPNKKSHMQFNLSKQWLKNKIPHANKCRGPVTIKESQPLHLFATPQNKHPTIHTLFLSFPVSLSLSLF